MAEKITAREVMSLSKRAGVHRVGPGLYLRVALPGGMRGNGKPKPAGCSWVFRYMINGKAREMGLDPYPIVTLERAREKALDAQRLKVDKKDPLVVRDTIRAAEQLEAAKAITFKDAAEKYIAVHKPGWKNEKRAGQWSATLATYAYPVFGNFSVASVDTALVTKVLEPIWSTKTETAGRLRGRIESILIGRPLEDCAKAKIPLGGVAIWKIFCLDCRGSRRSNTTQRFLIRKSLPS